MVDLIRKIESKHEEYISWLESQKTKYTIRSFLDYVIEKKENYKKFMETCNLSFIDELPRSMNRYLDEFTVDYQFTRQSNIYTNELTLLINELKREYFT